MNMDIYSLGDKIRWSEGLAKKPHQKRPENGNFSGDGYVECINCTKDFWIEIAIENDTINKVNIDLTKNGYVK